MKNETGLEKGKGTKRTMLEDKYLMLRAFKDKDKLIPLYKCIQMDKSLLCFYFLIKTTSAPSHHPPDTI